MILFQATISLMLEKEETQKEKAIGSCGCCWHPDWQSKEVERGWSKWNKQLRETWVMTGQGYQQKTSHHQMRSTGTNRWQADFLFLLPGDTTCTGNMCHFDLLITMFHALKVNETTLCDMLLCNFFLGGGAFSLTAEKEVTKTLHLTAQWQQNYPSTNQSIHHNSLHFQCHL